MPTLKYIRHYHQHFGYHYPTSLAQKLYSIAIAPLIFIVVSFIILQIFSASPISSGQSISFFYLGLALGATFLRLFVAYVLSLIVAIFLAVLVSNSSRREHLFLPLFDIIQSIPVLAFFPIVITFFLQFNFSNGAAVSILFLSMLWNIVFNLVGGLKVIPKDIKLAAHIFGIQGFAYIWRVLLPAVFPYMITGSLLAWAQGWNIIIVAEVLHTYIPHATSEHDLFGIGAILVNSITSGQNDLFLAAILLMIMVIAFLNFFLWQKLLSYAEKYKFE